MNRPPDDKGPAPPLSRNGDAAPSEIDSTPSRVNDHLAKGNHAVAYCDEHVTPEECAAADVAALLDKDNASGPSSEPAPMADFLRTRELPPRLRGTVISHPLPQGDGAPSSHIDRVVFWETTPDREERRRTYAILRLLHRRKLLPLGALIIARLEGGLAIAVDMPDPERFAAYQKKLNGLQWAFAPWNVRACTFTETQYRLAENLKLGIVYHDELPGEQLP